MADQHFLSRINGENNLQKKRREDEEEETSERIELTLGLSMNGKFGVDPIRTNKLKRSCSAISTLELEPAAVWGPPSWGGDEALARTCSLPVDAEDELRRRKELQTLRRREAKRRLSEKQRNYGGGGVGVVAPKEDYKETAEEEESLVKIVSQRSSGSSGLSELESQTTPPHGMNKITEAKSPQSAQSFPSTNEQTPEMVNGKTKLPRSTSAAQSEMEKNMLAGMPCVSTKGDGPNGKRIDGFLYQYKKGKEVRIVCVCHGSFLTPAEFVKHAGGGDVQHPLRHIVVNPSPLP